MADKKQRSISEINERLKKGDAVVLTAKEFKDEVRKGTKFKLGDVDVVTTATRAVTSATSAMLLVPVSKPGIFTRARMLWLNGVPGYPGPAPNERLDCRDTLVHGTAASKYDPHNYGGGHLFRDMIEGKEIYVECESIDGRYFESHFKLEQLEFARMYNFRSARQRYACFSNLKNLPSYIDSPRSIFNHRSMTVSGWMTAHGSGELNPVHNDPLLRAIRVGTKILVNKAPGIVVGCGTRSEPGHIALAITADMFGMDAEFMGGFRTSGWLEQTIGIAIPIPILDQEAIDTIAGALDENITFPLSDIGDRLPLYETNYGEIWTNADLEFEFDPDKCIRCSQSCIAEYYCPMNAIDWQRKKLDEDKCFHCGACNVNCPAGAFKPKGGDYKGHLGLAHVKGLDTPLAITWRLCDRLRTIKLTEHLKEIMQRGEFLLADTDFMITYRTGVKS